MAGRTISIFLVDGSPTGMRKVEVGLSTIVALIAPRTLLPAITQREESKRTGVYILVGDDAAAPGRRAIYVGEGDIVLRRIIDHDARRDFWETMIVFVSKDLNLTKAHVRWLEARLVAMARQAKRVTVVNDTDPTGGVLPEAAEVEMTEFIDQILMVLGTVGVDAFSPAAPTLQAAASATPTPPRFYLKGEGYDAVCVISGDAMVVQKGSIARKIEAPALQPTYKALRAALLQNGVLTDGAGGYVFEQDYAFASPSQSAAVVSGTTLQGRTNWHLDDGTTYAAWEAANTPSIAANDGEAEA